MVMTRFLSIVIRLACCASVLAASLGLSQNTALAAADGQLKVVERQSFEIEGFRPIGLSPDGNWLAGVDFGYESLCISSVSAPGAQTCASLEPIGTVIRIGEARWSPDSTRLALSVDSWVTGIDGDIWVMKVETGKLANITDDQFEGSFMNSSDSFNLDSSPAWTPDSSEIAFFRSSWAEGQFQSNEIMMIPVAGGKAESLVLVSNDSPIVPHGNLNWTSDGSKLFYSVFHFPDNRGNDDGIYRFDRGTGSKQRVFAGDDGRMGPVLLQANADGSHLLVWYPDVSSILDPADPYFWLVDIGSAITRSLNSPKDSYLNTSIVSDMTFSPAGNLILLVIEGHSGGDEAWIIAVDGSGEQLLADGFEHVYVQDLGMALSWSNDGSIFLWEPMGIGTLLQVEELV